MVGSGGGGYHSVGLTTYVEGAHSILVCVCKNQLKANDTVTVCTVARNNLMWVSMRSTAAGVFRFVVDRRERERRKKTL